MQEKVREHVRIASELEKMILNESDFELLAPRTMNVVCFRYRPSGYDAEQLNKLNEILNHRLNDTGKIYLTHTSLNGRYTLRMVIAQTNVTMEHVRKAWSLILENARSVSI